MVFTATAQAVQRYASPSGSGSQCTLAQPCALTTALSGAQSSDEVIIAGNAGSYGTQGSPLPSLETGSSAYYVSIHGAVGQPRPVIFTNGGLSTFCSVSGQCPSISDVDIEMTSSGTALSADGNVDHVIARAHSGGEGCTVSGVSTPAPSQQIVDSVCASDGGGSGLLTDDVYGGGVQTAGIALNNDTIIASGGFSTGIDVAITCSAGRVVLTVTATNVIARGGSDDVAASATNSGGSATADVNLDHSNFAITATGGSGTAVINSGAGNQMTTPTFANAAEDDFHEAPGSVTIDAGVSDPASGSTDLEGNPRARPGRLTCGPAEPAITDIGAYEFVAIAPPCPPPLPPDTRITMAKIRPRRATFRFTGSGGSGSLHFECRIDRKPFRVCHSPKTYKPLKPGIYQFAVRAVSERGEADPTPATRRFRIPRHRRSRAQPGRAKRHSLV